MKKLFTSLVILFITPLFIWGQGNTCINPIIVNVPASLPYSDLNQTCGRGNNYSNTCLGNFDGGEDIIYQLVISTQTELLINMDPLGYKKTGMLIDDECPNGSCLISVSNNQDNIRTINIVLNAGIYYLMIDSDGGCFNFNLSIEEIIPPPEFEIRITENVTTGLMDVQMRETTGNIDINTSTQIDDIDFTIRWAPGTDYDYSTDVTVSCTDYHIADRNDPYTIYYTTDFLGNPTWFLRVFTVSGGAFNSPEIWTTNNWVTIASLRAREIVYDVGGVLTVITSDAAGWGYEIAPDGWIASSEEADPMIEITNTNYDPTINGDVTAYQMPTIVDFIWEGGDNTSPYDGNSWINPANWRNMCGNTEMYDPGPLSNCIIPAGKSQYPKYSQPNNLTWNMGWGKTLTVENGGEINWEGGTAWNYLMAWDNLNVETGGDINLYQDGSIIVSNIWTTDSDIHGSITASHVDTDMLFNDNLNIYNTSGISTLGWLTVNGDTYIGAPEGLIIRSNNTGTGSFLNGGSVSYSANGTAQIETYITGVGNPLGAVYMHFTGPTVHDIAYRNTSSTGVRLEQFNMTTLDTYAYEWDSGVDTTLTQPWVNVWPFDYNVPLANGLAITNYVAGNGTMYMEGSLVTGSFTTYTIQDFANNSIELISNPYPTAINFDEFYDDNDTKIEGKYNIMNGTDNWTQYVSLTGVPAGYEYIQMGQGFMVLPIASGVQLQFNDDIREHNDVSFRSIDKSSIQIAATRPKESSNNNEIQAILKSKKHQLDFENWINNNPTERKERERTPNQLTLIVEGGGTNFKDQTSIYFWDGATKDYDEEFESIKWNSMNENATMIRSITNDNFDLAVNALPLEKLNVDMVSVPIQFECGYEGEYTFTFTEIESFEGETEIWLEDLHEDNYWFSVTPDNNLYTFNASVYDDKNRFVVHFFGPTGNINDGVMQSEEEINIYSFKNNVYVINNSDEKIKDIAIYDLLGSKIYQGNSQSHTMNKIKVSDKTAYYVVRVLTDKNIYSEKVFIMK